MKIFSSGNNALSGILIFGLFLCVAMSGCSNQYNLQEIIGTVTLDGEPAEGVGVIFTAMDPEGRDCGGRTDANGVFTMTSSVGQGGDGTSPGKYKVYFEKMVSAKELPSKDPRRTKSAMESELYFNGLPKRYQVANGNSGFEVEVIKGKNKFNFDLTSKE
ncbi:MAG: hypothetical protein Q4G68_10175 [Planctomycetia bacterium]|nr:hypothetical protein [Planctomycetia bacterium]